MKQVEIARSLLGVPWVHQGRDPTVGIDCIGLLLLCFNATDDTVYGRDADPELFEGRAEFHLGPPVDDEPQVGDVVLLGFGHVGRIRHIAIIGDYPYGGLSIIHTDSIVGRVVEQRFDNKWRVRVRKVYRR